MGKMTLFMMISLDGYMEGPNHDLSWHNVDKEFNDFAAAQLDEASTLVFGRRTYELMANFWPTQKAKKIDPIVAERMNNMPKVVISRSLEKISWSNTRLINSKVVGELTELKKHAIKKLLVLGSNNLSVSLLKMSLLDELRLMVNPIIIGNGTALFKGSNGSVKLDLLQTKEFMSGNVLLTYKPVI